MTVLHITEGELARDVHGVLEKARGGCRRLHMQQLLTVVLPALLLVTPLICEGQPKFEAASVRRTDRCSPYNSVDPSMIALNNDPLKLILREAFNVPLDRIFGPSWLETDCFTVVAKLPDGAAKDQLPAMLQALLVERFKLASHTENRPRTVYGLSVDKAGPKFKESDQGSISSHAGQVTFGTRFGRIKGSITMASFTRLLSNRLGSPVQDLTGLDGTYDIDLKWVPDRALENLGFQTLQNPMPALPTDPTADIFAAIRESLGLRLESHKGQVEVVVIDHIERHPTEN
jgi:uncharacterized protein (TIGR03435 family)